jgi:APA family basic amino acid/polyamine antiporter
MTDDPRLATDSAPRTLPRAIGTLGSTAIVVGTIIGSGIFLVPHNVARQVGSVEILFAVWILGGALAFAGALSLAELGAAIPEAGGVYIFLRQAYGGLFAFLYGWAELLIITPGGIAALAVAFGIYSASLLPLSALGQKVVAATVIAILTGVNVVGVRESTIVQTIFTIAKLAGLAVIVGFAVFSSHAVPVAATGPLPVPHTSLNSFTIALVAVLWAYNGWHQFSLTAGEVKNPARVIPRSYVLGMLVIIGVYLMANLAYLRVLPLPAMAEHQRAAASAMEALAGPRGASFVSVLILCSVFGALNGNVLAGPRVLFAMARDGLFFSAVARVHPRFKTPAAAVLVQGVWALALAMSGTYEQLFTYVVFAAMGFLGAAAVAVVVLRRKLPDLPRPYRVWGYPVLPIAFAVASLLIVALTLVSSPLESLFGLGLVLTGVPVYFAWRRWPARQA